MPVPDAITSDLSGKRLLVVEDDAMVGMTLVSYLEQLGAQVFWGSSVAEAQRGMDDGALPDMAIVDLNLDGETSAPVLDRLIGDGVRIVLCTGYEESSIAERFRGLPRAETPFTRAKIRRLLNIGGG